MLLFFLSVEGWHNSAALSYLNPTASHPSQNQNPSQFSGYNLSYGFAPDILPSHIPNPSHPSHSNQQNTASHPIGWAIGGAGAAGDSSSFSYPPPQHDPIQSTVEVPCQAIRVSEDDMPNYLFKFPSVSGQ